MIKLEKPDEKLEKISPFLKKFGGKFNDLTIGTRFAWDKDAEFAVVNGTTLIMRENYGGTPFFYYPLGPDKETAFCEMEKFCIANGEAEMGFACLDDAEAAELSGRYPCVKVSAYRDWADYVYPAEQFKTYAGKKLSGQRNHVNKFKKTYPGYRFIRIAKEDVPKMKDFLKEYEAENVLTGLAEKEQSRAYAILENMEETGQFGGYIQVDGKVVSLSIGEKVGDTLFVHIEKGLKEYEGVYPTTAQEFAKAFATEEIKFINREEDCGDMGLRISKMQYHPSEIRIKNFLVAKTSFGLITPPVSIKTERLAVTDIFEEDKALYAKLYTDEELNRFYGYDYRKDLGENKPDGDYFFGFMNALKAKKEEYSLAVRLCGKIIGEIVFYNFGFIGEAEIGFRFFKEYQGKGYAAESVKAAIDYAFKRGFKKITCRHFKENARSEKLVLKLGFIPTGETETHKFYELIK